MDFLIGDTVLYVSSMVGSIAFALSGYFLAVRKELDLMGAFILSFLTANGGGVVRDILINRPIGVLQSTEPFWIVLAVVICAWLVNARKFINTERRWAFIISDAVGLCAFAITGAIMGIDADLHFFGVITLSLLTASGGGVMRDLLVNDVPEILQGGFYGSVAVMIAIGLYALNAFETLNAATIIVVFILGFIVRLIAFTYRWRIPHIY